MSCLVPRADARTVGYKTFLGVDVVVAAKARTALLFDQFDTVVVSFSGGKDSMALLMLCLDEAERRGQLPLRAMFLDEELLPDSVVDFVDKWRQDPRLRLDWIAVPQRKERSLLGATIPLTVWDPAREWVRPRPSWAVRDEANPTRVFRQQDMNEWLRRRLAYRGRVCMMVGIRAAESLMRMQAVANKRHEPWISSAFGAERVRLGRPIYDWTEDDVLKYLHDRGEPWCSVYETQQMACGVLRVSTPLHAGAMRTLPHLKAMEPDLYRKIRKLWPETDTQARYTRDLDTSALSAVLEASGWAGAREYLEVKLAGHPKLKAILKRWAEWKSLHDRKPKVYTLTRYCRFLAKGQFIPMHTPENQKQQAAAALKASRA